MWWLIGFGIYLIICVLIYFTQENFIFRPEKLSQNFQFKYDFPFEELFYDMPDGARINALFFPSENSKGLVFYFHGNRRSIKGYGKISVDFTKNNYDVLMISYRGFGKSTGRRSEKNILTDAQTIYRIWKEKYGEERIIVFGRSMGSGFATKIAALNRPKMLLLDAPYYSFISVAARYTPFIPLRYLLRYPVTTYKWIRNVRCPIYIIHGTKDKLIPYRSSVRLRRITKPNSMLLSIKGAGHNNLRDYPEYHTKLARILNETLKVGQVRKLLNQNPLSDDERLFHF